jgi:hypothetical protein
MRKTTTAEIVKRAKEFADISNSDIISYEEEINYLNDAWKQCYQLMINKHDLFFIKEVRLVANGSGRGYTSYELPEDVYQIESISNPESGSVWTRHAVSEGFDNGSYEIVNNKLRIYGFATNIVLRYWVNPMYLTFPNKKITLDTDIDVVVDTAGNNALLTDGRIINLVSGNEVGEVDGENISNYHLGNGHIGTTIIADGVRYLVIAGYNGREILTKTLEPDDVVYWFKDENYNLLYTINDELYLGDRLIDNVDVADDGVYIGGKIYQGKCFPIKFEGKDCYLEEDAENNEINIVYTNGYKIPVDVEDIIVKGFCKYGLITSNGTVTFLQSYMPNVVMNLPNEIFFSLLAAQLATYYCAKQNADNNGVTAMLMAYRQQYMDSISQDSTYGRIINVY